MSGRCICRSFPSRCLLRRAGRARRPPPARRSRCGLRLTRCISTRESSRIPHGAMVERGHVEIGAHLAVEPHQQVLVERRGHAERIVIGQQQVTLRLDEIGADNEGIARPQRRADRLEKRAGPGRVEVADVRPRNSTAKRSPAARDARCDRQPVFIALLVRHDDEIATFADQTLAPPTTPRPTRPQDRRGATRRCDGASRWPEQQRELVAVAASELDQAAAGCRRFRRWPHDAPQSGGAPRASPDTTASGRWRRTAPSRACRTTRATAAVAA